MPDITALLTEAASLFGPSGQETEISAWVAEQFRPYVDEVHIDPLFNVMAHKKGKGPKVMLCAHLDEIAMTVSGIEEDGSLCLHPVGGIDTRTLPGSRVWVHTGSGRLFGTIGAIPPHLSTPEQKKKNYAMDDLHADVGLTGEEARERIHIGDIVTFQSKPVLLRHGQFACKTMDDRSCVVLLLEAARRLQQLRCDADVWFVATSQEEVGLRGATAAAFSVDPDLAIVLDTDFAPIPGSEPGTTVPMDRMSLVTGPYAQPRLTQRMLDCARAHHVQTSVAAYERGTGTDADKVIISRGGIPTVIMSLPLKYMHTTVETIDTAVLSEGARLIAHFLNELDSSWEDDLWI